MLPFARVTIIGLGLIGSSIARAVRQAMPTVRLTGHDADPTVRATATRIELCDVSRSKRHVDQRLSGLRRIAPVPVRLAQPVAEFRRTPVLMRLDAATTEECARIRFGDRVDALANRADVRASHEVRGIRHRVGMRHARNHGGDVGIVGKMGKGVDIVFVGCAQHEPR